MSEYWELMDHNGSVIGRYYNKENLETHLKEIEKTNLNYDLSVQHYNEDDIVISSKKHKSPPRNPVNLW